MTKHTILFLAANPSGTDRLALDREARAIHAELKRSGYRDRFVFETRWAAEPLDLLRELRELKPTVVHFSSHGGETGLCFQTARGHAQVVPPAALAAAFGAAGGSVKLVVLNACYSEPQADALLAHIDHVVGIGGSIHEDAARSFAIGFYGGLGEHESIMDAYRHGRAAIDLQGVSVGELPQLKVRAGVDATQLILAAVAPPQPEELPPCPYPGMRPYSADTATHFHGRSAEIDGLLGRLRAGERELYVIGPSGSGKSSLVAAGVLPRLARGVSGVGPFVVRSIRPGEHPTARLSEVLERPEAPPEEITTLAKAIAVLLAHRAPGTSLLLVIDQLEELFTLASAGERAKFLDTLRALRAEPRCVLMLVLRADLYGALMDSPLWADLHGQLLRIDVAPLRGPALREAIERPAHDLAVSFEPALVERLLADAASEPGILPLLQETLNQLWDRQRQRMLALADYEALGDSGRSGLAVAIAHRADATLRKLTSPQQTIARRILLRLVSFGEGRSDTRRQQSLTALRASDDGAGDFDEVIHHLVDHRLLSIDDGRVDLAHEVMIAAWPALATWIQTRREDEQRRRQLEAAAEQWVARGRGAGGLLDPIELADAETWQRTESARELGQSTDVAELVTVSRAVQRKQRRRRRSLIWSTFAALFLFGIIVTMLAITARHQASKNQDLLARIYKEAGRQLLLDGHPLEAIPYLVAARQKGEESSALRMLFWTARRSLPLIMPNANQSHHDAVFSPDGTRIATTNDDQTARIWDAATGKLLSTLLGHHGEVLSAAFSPDGTCIVTTSADGTARIWDVATAKLLAPPLEHRGQVRSAAFSPDGTRIVTVSWDKSARVWDVATGKPLGPPLEHQERVRSAVFSLDGTRIVTASNDQTAQVWDAITGQPLTPPLKHRRWVNRAAFSPDGTRIVTASDDKTAQVWNAATGEPLTLPLEHRGWVNRATFSPDGTRIVTASQDSTARVWDAATGEPLTPPLQHQGEVRSAAFSPDGTRIVTASVDKTARVWNAMTGEALTPFLQHQGEVWNATFSPDGTCIVTAGKGPMRVWGATSTKLLTPPLQHQAAVWNATFSPDGARIVTVSVDKSARVWDAATGKLLAELLEHRGGVQNAAFSSDGTRIVTASKDSTARVWDIATGKPLTPPLHHQGAVWSAAFSPDGTRVATAGQDGAASVWDTTTSSRLANLANHSRGVRSVIFNPDGTRIATASEDGTAKIWDVVTGKSLSSLRHDGPVFGAAFSPDGTRLITASGDRTAQVWDTSTGKPLAPPLEHQGRVNHAVFSPDGTRAVTASDDQTAQVWDATNGKPLAAPLEHQGPVYSATFSFDGTRIVTASADGTGRVWDATSGKPLTPPLRHQGPVHDAAFSPDGTHVVTASADNTARVWETHVDEGTFAEWSALAEGNLFVLSGGVHMRRAPYARR